MALTAPCNQPALTADNNDKLRVDLQLKDKTLKTYDDLEPKRVLVRACYTSASAVDRPWRRGNDVIDVSSRALCILGTLCIMVETVQLCAENSLGDCIAGRSMLGRYKLELAVLCLAARSTWRRLLPGQAKVQPTSTAPAC
jgi:hypothetical protein